MAVWMRNVLLAALAVATLAGNVERLAAWVENVERLRGSWAGRDYRSSGDYIDGSRWMVERYVTPGADVYLTHEGTRGFQSVDRSRHLALSWAMCPMPVRFGAADGIGNAVADVIGPPEQGRCVVRGAFLVSSEEVSVIFGLTRK